VYAVVNCHDESYCVMAFSWLAILISMFGKLFQVFKLLLFVGHVLNSYLYEAFVIIFNPNLQELLIFCIVC